MGYETRTISDPHKIDKILSSPTNNKAPRAYRSRATRKASTGRDVSLLLQDVNANRELTRLKAELTKVQGRLYHESARAKKLIEKNERDDGMVYVSSSLRRSLKENQRLLSKQRRIQQRINDLITGNTHSSS